MLLGMIFRLYSKNFVEIQALFPEILRIEFVTLFVEHPVLLQPVCFCGCRFYGACMLHAPETETFLTWGLRVQGTRLV